MKFLNFSKVKKSVLNFVKQVVGKNKRKYNVEKVTQADDKKAPSGSYSNRKGGYKHYTHILKPINNRFSVIFRNFAKQKLLGSIFIQGSKIYKIERNPYFNN